MTPTAANTVFMEHFDHLLATPDSVERLNQAILDLAVRGKLVPQDPNDEPASELLKRIKIHVVDENVNKNITPLKDEETPYQLPPGWIWTRLPDIGLINPRNTVDDDAQDAAFIPMPYIPESFGGSVKFDIRPWGEIKKGYTHVQEGDVVVAKITPCFENGKAAVMRGLINGIGAGTTELHVFRGDPDYIRPEYVLIFFKNFRFQEEGKRKMTGSAGQQRVPKEHITLTLFPLPPFAEQHRIVARVEQLFAQTRQLAELLSKAQTDLTHLNEAALHHLLAAKTPEDFNARWDFIAQHFDLLYGEPEHITPLRQAILELAVRGKLTRQDPNDEPASELLMRIQAEKAQLVKEGKIAQSDPLPKIREDVKPFDLPKGWEWARIDDIADHRLGKMLDVNKNKGQYLPYLRNLNVQWLRIDLSDVKQLRFESDEVEEYSLKFGDLLICEGGEPGRCAIWEHPEMQMMFQKAVHRVRPFGGVVPKYILYHLWADARNGALDKYFTGATIKHFTGKALATYMCALPSLAEQQRIVARVDQLLGLCDALEAKLQAAQVDREKLVEAVIAGVAG